MVLEYAKTFSSLMLDIKNMFLEDKLLNFLSGLQPCDLPTSMFVADALVDYKYTKPSGEDEKYKYKDKGKGKDKQKKDGKKNNDK